MSRRLWAAELRGRLSKGVVPHCFRRYLSVRSCQSHRHLPTRCAECFGRSLCSSSYLELPCLWRLWGEVSGEVRRCQLRRVGCSARWLAQARIVGSWCGARRVTAGAAAVFFFAICTFHRYCHPCRSRCSGNGRDGLQRVPGALPMSKVYRGSAVVRTAPVNCGGIARVQCRAHSGAAQ